MLNVRASIDTMSEREREGVLSELPRYCLEPVSGRSIALHAQQNAQIISGQVFLAYCNWRTGRSEEPFCSLTRLVADLDMQIYKQACSAFQDLTFEAWTEQVQLACEDQDLMHELAKSLSLSLVGQARRVLQFQD